MIQAADVVSVVRTGTTYEVHRFRFRVQGTPLKMQCPNDVRQVADTIDAVELTVDHWLTMGRKMVSVKATHGGYVLSEFWIANVITEDEVRAEGLNSVSDVLPVVRECLEEWEEYAQANPYQPVRGR